MKLIRLDAGATPPDFTSTDENVVVGRQPARGISIPHATISREHARLFRRDGAWSIADLNSANGTFVNGERVSRHALQAGDVIRLGEISLRFEPADAPAAAGGGPSEEELFGGIELEEDHLKGAPPASPVAMPQTIATRLDANVKPAASAASGSLSAKSQALLRDTAVQSRRREGGGTVLSADVGQYSGTKRGALILVAIAIAAALFWATMKLTEEVVPEGAPPADSTPVTPDEPGAATDGN